MCNLGFRLECHKLQAMVDERNERLAKIVDDTAETVSFLKTINRELGHPIITKRLRNTAERLRGVANKLRGEPELIPEEEVLPLKEELT